MKAKRWMRVLARHFDRARRRDPDRPLLLLFDIDGTILDMRHAVLHLLRRYDREHASDFFAGLSPDDVTVHEQRIDDLVEALRLAPADAESVLDWYEKNAGSPGALIEGHRPFRGVLEVIRWFQIQPNTFVGLNSGRPESSRAETLALLNELGREYRVRFDDELLFLRDPDLHATVWDGKVAGVQHFWARGFRLVAMVDNEPEALKAISRFDPAKEILLLHADTLFTSGRRRKPRHSVSGRDYDLTSLIPEEALPRHVQLVWRGVNGEANLRQFLASNVSYAEADLRRNPATGGIVLRHPAFDRVPADAEEPLLGLGALVDRLAAAGRGLKAELRELDVVADAVELLAERGLDDSRLWFSGRIEEVRQEGFERLAAAFPYAVRQAAVDFLGPLVVAAPDRARDAIEMLEGWGVNRFSVRWGNPLAREIVDALAAWDRPASIEEVAGLEAFLRAVLLLPTSIASDFNFPEWAYYGHGAGPGRGRHRYALQA